MSGSSQIPASAETGSGGYHAEPQRILFVDDDELILRSMARVLRQHAQQASWELHFVSDGEVALELLAQKAFDVVLVDAQMPRMSGTTLLRRVQESMTVAKENFAAIPAESLQDFTKFAPPAVAARAMRMYSRLRIADRMNPPFNLIISNVPGPSHSLYSAGARLEHFYPVSAIADGQGLNMTVQSYNGNLDFGFIADRDLVPDLWSMTDLLHDSMQQLLDVI